MVCIAAFIILALIGVFVAIISLFKPEVGKKYLKIFKKSWGCLWKKVRLQKCETGFKEDVKNIILSRVIVKHPKWVKPLSVVIEIVSVIIVVIAVWAILTAIKSLLALWALGTCNVTKPAACSFGAEVCSIDEEEPDSFWGGIGRWFTEWPEIIEAIPDKFKTYKAEDYDFNYVTANPDVTEKPILVDILDPGCAVCLTSYKNQHEAGVFENYSVRIVPYAIQDADGNYKFKNSALVVKYMFAVEQVRSGVAIKLLDYIFTRKNHDGYSYQTMFNEDYSEEQARAKLEQWLKELDFDDEAVAEVRKIADYPEIADKMQQNREIVENQLHAKGIPTTIYDGKKHTGLWKSA